MAGLARRIDRLVRLEAKARSGPNDFNARCDLAEADARAILAEPGMSERLMDDLHARSEAAEKRSADPINSLDVHDEILARVQRLYGESVGYTGFLRAFLDNVG